MKPRPRIVGGPERIRPNGADAAWREVAKTLAKSLDTSKGALLDFRGQMAFGGQSRSELHHFPQSIENDDLVGPEFGHNKMKAVGAEVDGGDLRGAF